MASLHLDAASTPETIAVWKDILDRLTRQPQTTDNGTPDDNAQSNNEAGSTEHNAGGNTNYALNGPKKKGATRTNFTIRSDDIDNNTGPDAFSRRDTMHSNRHGTHHLPLSNRIKQAENLVKWMLCVPRLSPTSKRFKYYADNWHVTEKIQRFLASGEFDALTKDCPAFSSEELRAALDYLNDSDTAEKPQHTTESENERQAFALA